jgi:hypothetical protein
MFKVPERTSFVVAFDQRNVLTVKFFLLLLCKILVWIQIRIGSGFSEYRYVLIRNTMDYCT